MSIGPFLIRGGVVWGEDNPFISPPQPFRVTLKGLGLCPRFRAEPCPYYPPPLIRRGGDIKGIGPFLIRGGVVWGPYGDNPFISPPKAHLGNLFRVKG